MKIPKSARQIAEALGLDIVIVSHNLKKLLKWKETKYIELPWYEARIILKNNMNHRTSFYYSPKISNPLEILQALLLEDQ